MSEFPFRRNRVLRPLKNAGIFLCAAFILLWAMTTQRWAYYFGDRLILGAAAGRLDLIVLTGDQKAVEYWRENCFHDFRMTDQVAIMRPPEKGWNEHIRGVVSGKPFPEQPYDEFLALVMPEFEHVIRNWYGNDLRSRKSGLSVQYSLICPLWIPTLLMGICSAILIWRDWPYPFAHCRVCNFNLESNRSGRCPECGTPLTAKQRLHFGIDVRTIHLGPHRRHRAS